MAVLQILHYPDERLYTVAAPVPAVDERIRNLVADMTATMYAAGGIGLAATQVNVHERVIVVDLSRDKTGAHVTAYINPVITARAGSRAYEEGCLSVPGVRASVVRSDTVTVSALDIHGNTIEVHAEGLLATCLQHEIDHLDGKLYIGLLSETVRGELVTRVMEIEHEAMARAVAAS